MTDVLKQKSALRETAVARRRNLADTAGPNACLRLADHIVAYLSGRPAGVVSGYLPITEEIDPLPALARLIRSGWGIAMPVVAGKAEPLVFRQWAEGDALEAGPLNTRHPLSSVAELRPDVLLVPLLAFDVAGQRIGWGGGFYDRTHPFLKTLSKNEGLGHVPRHGGTIGRKLGFVNEILCSAHM